MSAASSTPPRSKASQRVAAEAVVDDAALRRSRRVLVVDDNRDAADSLQLLLQSEGHDAQVAYDGASALEEAARRPPDLVLLDLGMPRMDGYEVARRMRAQAAGARMTLAALTGWGRQEDLSRSRDAGFDHHLVKPVDLAALDALFAELDAPPDGR